MASIINPLGSLYKTQVRELASILGVDKSIIDKAPSADLAPGQTDEGDFGFTYKEADEILEVIYDRHKSEMDLVNLGYSIDLVKKVVNRVEKNKFKREIPIIIGGFL